MDLGQQIFSLKVHRIATFGIVMIVYVTQLIAASNKYYTAACWYEDQYLTKDVCDTMGSKHFGRPDITEATRISNRWRAPNCFTTHEYRQETRLEKGGIWFNTDPSADANYWSTVRICEKLLSSDKFAIKSSGYCDYPISNAFACEEASLSMIGKFWRNATLNQNDYGTGCIVQKYETLFNTKPNLPCGTGGYPCICFSQCPAGSYCVGNVGSISVIPCPNGKFGNSVGKTTESSGCPYNKASCPLGFYCPGTGGEAKICPQGKYANDHGMSKCNPCPVGKYTDQEGSKSCLPVSCPAGRFAVAREGMTSSTCLYCPLGKFSDAVVGNTTESCKHKCPRGKFGSVYGKFTEAESCTVMGTVAENSEFYFPFNFSFTDFNETAWRVLDFLHRHKYSHKAPQWERQTFAGKDTICHMSDYGPGARFERYDSFF